jgi:hypothetical protein
MATAVKLKSWLLETFYCVSGIRCFVSVCTKVFSIEKTVHLSLFFQLALSFLTTATEFLCMFSSVQFLSLSSLSSPSDNGTSGSVGKQRTKCNTYLTTSCQKIFVPLFLFLVLAHEVNLRI